MYVRMYMYIHVHVCQYTQPIIIEKTRTQNAFTDIFTHMYMYMYMYIIHVVIKQLTHHRLIIVQTSILNSKPILII